MKSYVSFYNQWGVYSVIIGGFTPIPFKIITITSGFMKFDFILFTISALMARGLRFTIEGLVIKFFADRGIEFLTKHRIYIFFILPLSLIILVIFLSK